MKAILQMMLNLAEFLVSCEVDTGHYSHCLISEANRKTGKLQLVNIWIEIGGSA